METNKLHAILSNLEVEGDFENGQKRKRKQYSVQISVADTVVAKSTHTKLRSSVLKWEWNPNNQIWFERSSTMKVEVYRGFKSVNIFNKLVGQYQGKVEELLDNDASFVLTNKKGNPIASKMKIAFKSPVSYPSLAIGGRPAAVVDHTILRNLEVEGDIENGPTNPFLIIGASGLPAGGVDPQTRVQRVGSVFYEGFKAVVEGIYDCSDIFLPLKTAAGVTLKIIKFVETVLENRKELEDLKAKLEAILSIVKQYQKYNIESALRNRIQMFSTAITTQLKSIEDMQQHSLPARVAEGTNDADKILKVIRNINSLCDVFQMDTQLNIEGMVGDILQRLNSASIEKLNHAMTSYKTRKSSYGDPTGCMPGTRVKVLEDLDAWASNANSSKVYWMVGMAGIGKSTIAHTFCENLEAKNILCGSFFASRASENTRKARLIIPVIAHALAKASPPIKAEVLKAIEDDPTLAEPTYIKINEQFKRLVYNPVRTATGVVPKLYKVVVIDGVDECDDIDVVCSFIKLVLEWASEIPLKILITSRDEYRIRFAFKSRDSIRFVLHEIEKDVVKNDIQNYLKTSLSCIKDDDSEEWPSPSELSGLVERSGTLFIYAATAVRYITRGDEDYKSRLSAMVTHGQKSINQFETDIDLLYVEIMERVCKGKEPHEVALMRDLLSITIFLRNPLPMEAITSLLQESKAHMYMSQLSSVIHIPNQPGAVVAPFHASFPDFITDSRRCALQHFSSERSSFPALDSSECHKLLALKCLELMNRSLKYNICEIPKELTLSRRDRANFPENIDKIPEVLKYSCIYWAAHLAEVKVFGTELFDALHIFLHQHLLHWIECLSILSELQTGLRSLAHIGPVLSDFNFHDHQLLVHDARRCLQMNFKAVQNHCMEIYQSALVWIPKNSLIRKAYIADVSRVPKVILGLSNSWGSSELLMQNGSSVESVAFSRDGSRVVSGSRDKTVRIWNVTTGEVEVELKGHEKSVGSVAFSPDGSQIVSGSEDQTVRIWNVTTGVVEAELKGHTDFVVSIAFSQDGSRVVSGSWDKTVRIWNLTTGQVEAELKGHRESVSSVAFSQDGSRVVSGSDQTIRIWTVATREVEAELKNGSFWTLVHSVAFSPDGSQVISGSQDSIVRIWNVTTGKLEGQLKGHTDTVRSVAFSQDGSRIVSGSDDKTVRIWNLKTGDVEVEMRGHTELVRSVTRNISQHPNAG